MMRMRHYSSRHEMKAPGGLHRALEFRDVLAATPPAAFFLAAVVR
jgi:hypothetical protein